MFFFGGGTATTTPLATPLATPLSCSRFISDAAGYSVSKRLVSYAVEFVLRTTYIHVANCKWHVPHSGVFCDTVYIVASHAARVSPMLATDGRHSGAMGQRVTSHQTDIIHIQQHSSLISMCH